MADDHTVLGRVLAIIDACLSETEPVSLAWVTRETGIPKASVRRIAEDLVRRGVLERTCAGYLSGSLLATFGERAARQQLALRHLVTPYLGELHGRTGAVVCVIRTESLDRWSVVSSMYDHVAAASGYADSWPHDATDPAILALAFGQVALAHDRDHAETLLRNRVPRMTPYTATHPLQIARALDRAATNGDAVEHEGMVQGWSCLAVPVRRDPGVPPRAVLAVVDRSHRFNSRRYLASAHEAAAGIEHDWLRSA